jgi:hypothetical protein
LDTKFFSRLEKDIKRDVQKNVEDLLGVHIIKRHLKTSVKKEVERALRGNSSFK